jgi:hypothetical protein
MAAIERAASSPISPAPTTTARGAAAVPARAASTSARARLNSEASRGASATSRRTDLAIRRAASTANERSASTRRGGAGGLGGVADLAHHLVLAGVQGVERRGDARELLQRRLARVHVRAARRAVGREGGPQPRQRQVAGRTRTTSSRLQVSSANHDRTPTAASRSATGRAA